MKDIITLPKSKPWKNTGHRNACTGAGVHKDRRTKRIRTRKAALVAAMKGSE